MYNHCFSIGSIISLIKQNSNLLFKSWSNHCVNRCVLWSNRSKRAEVDSESSELSISEKNKAIEDGQNNNIEPAAYLSG